MDPFGAILSARALPPVFLREPWEGFARETVARLKSGALDDQLVYRKRLRQPLDAYRRNVPPHVQAARKLENPGRVIRYLTPP